MKTKNLITIVITILILLFSCLLANAQTMEEWFKNYKDLVKQGKYEEAIEYCDKALSKDSNNSGIWLLKGVCLFYLKKYNKAIDCCNTGLLINPNIAEAWELKGNALLKLKKYEETIVCCDKALSINPDIAGVWSLKGDALGGLGKNEQAIDCAKKSLSLNPKNIEAWIVQGCCLIGQYKYEDAIKCATKALEIESGNSEDNARAWTVMGLAQCGLKRYEEAIWACDKALAIEPNNPLILEAKKLALDALGENKEILWVPQKYFDYITNTSNLYYTSINLERTADEKFYKVKILAGQESLPIFWVANVAEIDFSNYQQGFTKNDINYSSGLYTYTRPAGGVSETCNFSGNYSSFGQTLQFLDFVGKINTLLNDMSGTKFSNDINYVYIPADKEGAYIIRIYNGASMSVPRDECELIKSLPRGPELSMQAYAGNIILIIYDICNIIMNFDDLQKKVEKTGININKIFYKTIKDATKIEKLKESSKEGIVNIARQYCLLFIDNLKLEFENSILNKVVKDALISELLNTKEALKSASTYIKIISLFPKIENCVERGDTIIAQQKALETAFIQVREREATLCVLSPVSDSITSESKISVRGRVQFSTSDIIPSGKVNITVNNSKSYSVEIKGDGYFNQWVELNPGENSIKVSIEARDAGGSTYIINVTRK